MEEINKELNVYTMDDVLEEDVTFKFGPIYGVPIIFKKDEEIRRLKESLEKKKEDIKHKEKLLRRRKIEVRKLNQRIATLRLENEQLKDMLFSKYVSGDTDE